jgi:hypothetical protein
MNPGDAVVISSSGGEIGLPQTMSSSLSCQAVVTCASRKSCAAVVCVSSGFRAATWML